MKKLFLIAGCISLLAVGIVTTSCKKEKEHEWKGCFCKGFDDEGDPYQERLTATEIKEETGGLITSCSALERLMNMAGGDVRCTDL